MPGRIPRKRNTFGSKAQPRTPGRKKTRRRPPASHLLIIECEPDKLARQQLDFGSRLSALFSLPFHKKKIVLVKACSRDELCRVLGETLQSHGRFRAVLMVGHSNEDGLQLTPDEFYGWKAIGEWLKPFQPEFLLLAACRAGRSSGTQYLFEQIPSLREIYASPVAFFSDQTHPFTGLLAALVKNRKIDELWFRAIQTAGYMLQDSLLYRWKRGEALKTSSVQRLGWDLIGDVLDRRPTGSVI